MDLISWTQKKGGVAHRQDAAEQGFSPFLVRAAIRAGSVLRLRAQWIAVSGAPEDLVGAAVAAARLTCISLARHRGWWIPEGADRRRHLHVSANGHRLVPDSVTHWNEPLTPRGPRTLTSSVEDALAHIAGCLTHEDARTVWESAVRTERIDIESLRAVRWRDRRSRDLAGEVIGLSDSGIETVFVVRIDPWGLPIRQQVTLAGRRVDVLIGTHLVVQIDGFAHHSSAAQRGSDVAHDAELRLRGYTVLRFTYAQIMHDWEWVQNTVAAAIARGLHRSPTVQRGHRSPHERAAFLRP